MSPLIRRRRNASRKRPRFRSDWPEIVAVALVSGPAIIAVGVTMFYLVRWLNAP